jgi:hypothetical protein
MLVSLCHLLVLVAATVDLVAISCSFLSHQAFVLVIWLQGDSKLCHVTMSIDY